VDVWCIGDINYFVSVLNGLAMLSNSGLFNDLIKLGLIIAVLVIGFQAIFQSGVAGGIPWGRFIMAFIAFKLLFGEVTTVHVNDTYTLQSRDVDNVPYGVARTATTTKPRPWPTRSRKPTPIGDRSENGPTISLTPKKTVA
jgi:hypothetical protein